MSTPDFNAHHYPTRGDRLESIFDRQQAFQMIVSNGDYPPTDPDHLMAEIRTQSLGVISEVNEALEETGWKPWATSNHINREAYLGELVDALHFLVNMALLAGITPDEIYQNYREKNLVNLRRQVTGYDGVSTKCVNCKRAYDDPAVKCQPAQDNPTNPDVPLFWCGQVEDWFDAQGKAVPVVSPTLDRLF